MDEPQAGDDVSPEDGAREPDVVPAEVVTSQVIVPRAPHSPARAWRERAVAVRTALPQLARNPVVVGASAAAATVAVRVAVDVARRALGGPSAARSSTLYITGTVVHQVHVVRHVHVFHHHPVPLSWRPPVPPP